MATPSLPGARNAPSAFQRQYVEDFFVYTATFAALAPAAVATQNIQIQANSAFKWQKSTYQADIAAAAYTSGAVPIPNVQIQITDSGTGRQLFSSALPVIGIFGNGGLPFILPQNRIFMERSNIQITATNFDAAVTYNLRLMLIGTKIFDLAGSGMG